MEWITDPQALIALLTLTVLEIVLGIDCLLYTSDAADERSSVDLGGRRIIKKKKRESLTEMIIVEQKK